MNAVDTNVLLYVHDPRDPLKQSQAAAIIASLPNAVLIWQVACEYVAASRKLSRYGFHQADAWRELNRLQLNWAGVRPQWSHLERAESLLTSHSLSFWDALLLAVALESGITTLYSEDLVGVGQIPGIRIVNPFAP